MTRLHIPSYTWIMYYRRLEYTVIFHGSNVLPHYKFEYRQETSNQNTFHFRPRFVSPRSAYDALGQFIAADSVGQACVCTSFVRGRTYSLAMFHLPFVLGT